MNKNITDHTTKQQQTKIVHLSLTTSIGESISQCRTRTVQQIIYQQIIYCQLNCKVLKRSHASRKHTFMTFEFMQETSSSHDTVNSEVGTFLNDLYSQELFTPIKYGTRPSYSFTCNFTPLCHQVPLWSICLLWVYRYLYPAVITCHTQTLSVSYCCVQIKGFCNLSLSE